MIIRIGTRASKLALVQAHLVRDRLVAAFPDSEVALVPITTTGDRVQEKPLTDLGGKEAFTKELQEALLAGTIDMAVHSMKDVGTFLPNSLCISAMLEREDVRDAFISARYSSLEALPKGARLGTSSPRRAAQMLERRPDLEIVPFRGNVQTRLSKLEAGVAEATLLALAGLKRLGMESTATSIFNTNDVLPAVAQGAIGIECRKDNIALRTRLEQLNHTPTFQAISCERAMLAELGGSCHTPIAGLAIIHGGQITLKGMLASADGQQRFYAEQQGNISQLEEIGTAVGKALKAQAGDGFIT